MGKELASLVFTDPPYGVDYDAPSGKHERLEGDALVGDQLIKLLAPAFKRAVLVTTDEAAFYIWHASATRPEFEWAMTAAGLLERQYLIWVKPSPALGYADYQWAHEPCFYAAKEGATPAWYGGRAQATVWRVALRPRPAEAAVALGNGVLVSDGEGHETWLAPSPPAQRKVRSLRLDAGDTVALHGDRDTDTVWEVARDTSDPDHPTQKPVELARRAIENSSKPGDIVLDSFLGSGSTLIAAERTGRRCYGIELKPKYVDKLVARWESATGATANRERA